MSLSAKINPQTLAEISALLLLLNTVGLLVNTSIVWLMPFIFLFFILSLRYIEPDKFYQALEKEGVIPEKNDYITILIFLSPYETFMDLIVDKIEKQRTLMRRELPQNKEQRIQKGMKEIQGVIESQNIALNAEQENTLQKLLQEEWNHVRDESDG